MKPVKWIGAGLAVAAVTLLILAGCSGGGGSSASSSSTNTSNVTQKGAVAVTSAIVTQ